MKQVGSPQSANPPKAPCHVDMTWDPPQAENKLLTADCRLQICLLGLIVNFGENSLVTKRIIL